MSHPKLTMAWMILNLKLNQMRSI